VGAPGNQSRTLLAEVDRSCYLDDIADLFTPAPGSTLSLATQAQPASTAAPDQVRRSARDFATTWLARAAEEELADLRAVRPQIPASLDAELLRVVQSEHGDLRARGELRRAARDAFWAAVDTATTA